MASDHDNTFTLVFLAVLGTLLVIAMVGVFLWLQTVMPGSRTASSAGGDFSFHSGGKVRLVPLLPPAEVEKAVAAINKGGCITCHTIPGVPGAIGQIGPNLSQIGIEAAQRREDYTALDYIQESILNPGAFTAPECPTGPCPQGVMPVVALEEAELEAIVKYLATLGLEGVAQAGN
jgi:mono/diheme cytochrome c family protein